MDLPLHFSEEEVDTWKIEQILQNLYGLALSCFDMW